ncbi:MAG: nucleoside triphosphate pyrophosphatase [Gudongella sp.]|jgi:septum formation protein|nr:nucleoside triphosphate pyrophosphatase [Gudongella sp.]
MKKIVLASGSPRRRELLSQLGVDFEVWRGNIKENNDSKEAPECVAMSLALQKGLEASLHFDDSIIIAADTIVVCDDTILGKPVDADDAYRMLKLLSGREHQVITGFALIDLDRKLKIVDYERTLVTFNELSENMIQSYIDTGEVFDKAGSYAIQGKGALIVKSLQGCYFNIVGFPISKIGRYLDSYFGLKLL